MLNLTFPDGAIKQFENGQTGLQIAESIAKSLAKSALAMTLDGVLHDLSQPIVQDAKIQFIKRDDGLALDMIRHDCAHVLAEAVQTLFPGTQVTIGPTIDNGFYYDFYREQPFTTDDFAPIEKEMRRIIERNAAFVREVWPRDKAIQFFKDKGELFKVELIENLPNTEDIKIYRQGDWLDLCRGPHMPSVGHVGTAFKLMKVAGAYWRGDSTRQQLTRIYCTAWRNDEELQEHLTQIAEAEKRDHRKLGREMDLFHLQEEAPGSVFWHPKGWVIWQALEGYIRRRLNANGYQEVRTPQLIDNKLWVASGHWGKYRENMFVVPDEVPSTDDDKPILSGKARLMALKPMNCPAHVQIFNQGTRSYRELPLRLAEFGCCHRNEAHGALHGIMRVRQFVQDDAHIFCRVDQIESEAAAFCELLDTMYKDLGFPQYSIKLATRPEQKHGTDAQWDYAEGALANALNKIGMPFTYAPGDGAFYGPKLEFHLTDAIGRTWTCGTLQLDTILPERLDAAYIGEDGNKHRPIMLHRAIVGSMERFIGILIESYAGKLPLWLAPVQVVVATITEGANDYARVVFDQLKAAGLRAELDTRNEKINYKVREHSLAKVSHLFVVGAKESENQTVAIRTLGSDAQAVVNLSDAIAQLKEACKTPY